MNKYVNGVLIALTEEEIAELNANSKTEEQILADQWNQVRFQRNEKLAETDWRASSDLTLSDDWKSYRQALRDITTQSDPYNIAWPTEPS
tara:strand:- start:2367 stop:2636 length:270 start_codon:yes stop_codon:yes gene_type:complete